MLLIIVLYVLLAVVLTYAHHERLDEDMSVYKNPFVRYLNYYILFLFSPIAYTAGIIYGILERSKKDE